MVDDDPEMNQAVERLLKAAGFSVTTFASAEALLRANAHHTAACLILDIHLPGLSGFELHEQLLLSNPSLPPVIFVTAYDEESSRQNARAAGAAGFFTKPFPGLSLVSTINRAIDERIHHG